MADGQTSELDRRSFLGYLGLGAGGLLIGGSKAANGQGEEFTLAAQGKSLEGRFIDQIAQNFRVSVPRTKDDDFKWGWKLKIQELCPDYYIVTAENEAFNGSNNQQADPTKLLTTYLSLFGPITKKMRKGGISYPNEVVWQRYDDLSTIVDNPRDNNAIKIYNLRDANTYLNNIKNDPDKRDSQEVKLASSLGLNLEDMAKVYSSALVAPHQQQMHYFLRGESDPHSITSIRPEGKGTKGKGLYEIVLNRVESDNTVNPVLVAHLDWGDDQAVLTRDDARSKLHGPYSKIYAWQPDSKGLEIKNFGVDTESQAESVLYLPALKNLPGIRYW
ncbi:MAG TPA: hypothetical protein VI564_06450 [Candidatus Nanoarchaeia archaeon]|nr:hypothetical protein [Candidatus Nanoarchaeia archaeon]